MRPLVAALLAGMLLAPITDVMAAKPAARIDDSSIEAFHASWDKLYNALSRTEQQQLQFAVVRIAMGHYRSAFDVPSNLSDIGPETIRGEIDGMTYADIIALAKKSSVTVERLPPCDPRRPDQHPCVK